MRYVFVRMCVCVCVLVCVLACMLAHEAKAHLFLARHLALLRHGNVLRDDERLEPKADLAGGDLVLRQSLGAEQRPLVCEAARVGGGADVCTALKGCCVEYVVFCVVRLFLSVNSTHNNGTNEAAWRITQLE